MGKYNYYCCGRYYQRVDLDTIDLLRREYDGYRTTSAEGGWGLGFFLSFFLSLFRRLIYMLRGGADGLRCLI